MLKVNFIVICGMFFLLTACVSAPPLISHVHVGHALTAWHDTPNKDGLFVIAKVEATQALEQADKAVSLAKTDFKKSQWHFKKALHIINPDIAPWEYKKGTYKYYGVIRALENTADHLEFALTSDDASLNFASHGAPIIEKSFDIAEQMLVDFKRISQIEPYTRNELYDVVLDLKDRLSLAVYGDASTKTVGLAQIEKAIEKMLVAERAPAYEPVARYYLFGLVQLETGQWGYNWQYDDSDIFGGDGGGSSY